MPLLLRTSRRAVVCALSCTLLFSSLASESFAETFNLKFGTLAPDNTPWSKVLQNFKKAMEGESGGRVKVKIYLDGKQGDERNMLQKMRFGQLTGGGFSTGGMAAVVPELQILELPFLFESNEETDYIMDKVLFEDLRQVLEKKGLYLYCWAENGWLDIGNSVRAIHGPKDALGLKLFAQESDVNIETGRALGAHVQVLAVPEVLGALQTGLLNAVQTTPIFATGTQWFTQIKYWTDSDHIYQPAAVVFDLKFWQSVPDDLKQIMINHRDETQAHARKDVRGIDAELFQGFRERKIEIHKPTKEERDQLRKKTAGVADVLIKKGAFPKEWYERVTKALADFRARKVKE